MTRTAVVTGVTGFIGGKLVQRLETDGWRVYALVRDTSSLPVGGPTLFRLYDRTVEGLTAILREAKPDVVFHLASLYLADHQPGQVEDLVSSNVLLPAQLAEAMTSSGVARLVNAGTAWQHFGTEAYKPVNLYAATKQACADLLLYYHDARNLSVVTLKLFDTYGAGDKRRKLVQLLVDAATSGERLEMSPGDQILDLTHVDDVVTAFILAAERLLSSHQPLYEDYLISGERLSVRKLADLVGTVLGCPIQALFGARPYRSREVMQPVSSGGRELPNWRPRHRLSDSIPSLT
jgi:nucleoside-diphosphate-sugar epimerase